MPAAPPRMSAADYRAMVSGRGPAPASTLPGTPTQHLRALGHLPAGTMNKTEARYAAYLDGLKLVGDVLWYAFEGITFHLARKTRLRVDFAVMVKGGEVQIHDVKGSRRVVTDDARAKMKVAAALFPFSFWFAYPGAGGFVMERVG